MKRIGLAAGLATIVAAALWYLAAPPKGSDGYRTRAAATLVSIHSQVQSARIWVESVSDGQATRASALVGLEEAEADANSAAAEFAGYEPPTGSNRVHARVTHLADMATSDLAGLRIAAEQERWDELEALAHPLQELAPKLSRAEEELGG